MENLAGGGAGTGGADGTTSATFYNTFVPKPYNQQTIKK